MASVASSSSGYGPFDSDGPDRNGTLHADPVAGETMVRACKSCVRLSMIIIMGGRAIRHSFAHPTAPILLLLSLFSHNLNIAASI